MRERRRKKEGECWIGGNEPKKKSEGEKVREEKRVGEKREEEEESKVEPDDERIKGSRIEEKR